MILTGGNESTREKTCHNVTSLSVFLTRTVLETNPGLRGKKPATSRLSHGIDLARFWNYRLVVANSSN